MTGSLHEAAKGRLSWYRQASQLAIALTGLLLLFWSGARGQQPYTPAAGPRARPLADSAAAAGADGVEQATHAFHGMLVQLAALLPRIAIAAVLLVLAGLLTHFARPVLRRLLRNWSRATGVWALFSLAVWLLALTAAASVLVGDIRALLGSVGLLGLAASWALQAPIESFAGWLVNSFRDYYRVGDRVQVNDVFGDVYRIDVLTTTLWEVGGPDKPVRGAQPTGALVTFPNSEVLRSSIVNLTRDLPYVWDELSVGIANESDLGYAVQVVADAARDVFGDDMNDAIERYRRLLAREGLDGEVSPVPQVYAEPTDAWTNLVIRYVVPARERRAWSTRLYLRVSQELAQPGHAGRIIGSYPVQRVQFYSAPELRPEEPPGH